MSNANGVILYEGSSELDGAPIVVIATGLKSASTNSKTGDMIQTYILRSDMPPVDAVKSGQDASICGSCVHRGNGTGKDRSCYVTLFHGPRAVYAAYKRGSYPKATPQEAASAVQGRMIRLGTYGDPSAAPIDVWEALLARSSGHTGYTHQWKSQSLNPLAWSRLVMASVDSVEEMDAAHALGYRTFRVSPEPFENIKGREIICPASDEMGKKTDCASCKACMGTASKAKVSIQIAAHGTGRKHVSQ